MDRLIKFRGNKDCCAVIDIDDIDDIVDEDCYGLAWTLDHGNFTIIGNIHDNRATCS